jgi:long-chain acyl-CoA synthetase
MNTLLDLLNQTISNYSNKTALMYKKSGVYEEISYETLTHQIQSFAQALKKIGIKKGDTISIISKNRPEWIISDFGAMSIGAILVPIYDTLLSDQVTFILNDAKVKLVVCEDKNQVKKILPNKSKIPTLEYILCPTELKEYPSVILFEKFLAEGEKITNQEIKDLKQEAKKITKDDIATIIYTSGTTGEQKGVILTHENIVSNCVSALSEVKIYSTDTSLSFLPFSHVYARTVEYYGLIKSGGTIAFAESLEKIVDNIQEIKPTIFFSVPRLYEKIYSKLNTTISDGPKFKKALFDWAMLIGDKYNSTNHKNLFLKLKHKLAEILIYSKIKTRLGGRIRLMFTGGGPISKDIQKFFYNVGLLILEGYGLTETSPIVTINRENDFKFGCIGKPIQGVDVKIAQDGEILVKGPNVMKGYLNRELETRAAFTSDGWFKTGDIGEIDTDGFVKITDRKKDIFVLSTGKNVAPQYIEGYLKLNKYISHAACIGHARHYISALICPNFEAIKKFAQDNNIEFASNDDLIKNKLVLSEIQKSIDEINSKLARFEQIKTFKLLPYEFSQDTGELTPTMKVKRNVIEKKFSNEINAMYA